MGYYRKITPINIIENDSGGFEVWAEKIFCMDYYLFFASQVSVKVNGNHYYLNNGLDRYRFTKVNTFSPFAELKLSISTYEVPLIRMRGEYMGLITGYKKAFEYFKRGVIYKARNEIIKLN